MNKVTFFQKKAMINCRGNLIDLSIPKVMGILNVTPDSFYDGGKYNNETEIIKRAGQIINEGGEIIDIGAASTRPGSKLVEDAEELKRLLPAIMAVRKNFPDVIISADTYHAAVAAEAINSGADIINDVSGGSIDAGMFDMIGKLKVPYVLSHIKGIPENMQEDPAYDDIVNEVFFYFSEKIAQLRSKGVADIIIDPGFGFGKNQDHNYLLLNVLEEFKLFECPVICGFSRKAMVNKILNIKAAEALNGTTVLNTIGLLNGADILRVHDVKEAAEAVKIVSFVKATHIKND